MKNRVLALAGLLQSLQQVQRMANHGQAETRPLAACIDSLFRFDAEDTVSVYGGAANLEPGLRRLLIQIDGGPERDTGLTRMAMSVMHLERRFFANPKTVSAVRTGLESIEPQREQWGPTHPTVMARLGELYAEQISPMGPRVLVQGNPVYLAQPDVVAEVRATLLAGLRSAVLWRQLGGSYWDFVIARRTMANAARGWL